MRAIGAIAVALAALAGCTSRASSCPDDGPGLVIDVTYLDEDCFFSTDVVGININVISGDIHLSKLDAISATRGTGASRTRRSSSQARNV